jgi:hypothetical protein
MPIFHSPRSQAEAPTGATPPQRHAVAARAARLVLTVLALWLGLAPAIAPGTERLVRVGLYENEPKVYTDASGHPAGLFVELLEAIARFALA